MSSLEPARSRQWAHHAMTRFKIQKRIEAAIQSADKNELRWALDYCESRLAHATMNHHKKHWRELIEQTQAALERTEAPEA